MDRQINTVAIIEMPTKKVNTSNLTIDASRKLSSIQEEFNTQFPYLKLEFFKHKYKVNGGSPKKDIISQDITLNQLLQNRKADDIVITPDMLVFELEQLFQNHYKISVQVFRKSGRSWLETSLTDDWTLKHQNDQGRELSQFL
jgi:hypothetical protein